MGDVADAGLGVVQVETLQLPRQAGQVNGGPVPAVGVGGWGLEVAGGLRWGAARVQVRTAAASGVERLGAVRNRHAWRPRTKSRACSGSRKLTLESGASGSCGCA